MKKLEDNRLKLDVLQQTSESFKKIKIATFSAVLTTYVCLGSMSSWASDIEIYTLPAENAGSGVVVMMLDTSGSMDYDQVGNSACDLPANTNSSNVTHSSNVVNGYTKNSCLVGATKQYKYSNVVSSTWLGGTTNKWYENCSIGSFGTISCNRELKNPPSVTGMESEKNGTTTYYYNLSGGNEYPDRISRLKDALYTIAMSPVDDPNTEAVEGINADVKIGIGTFPYYGSSSDNNKRGIIRIPANKWGAIGSEQRTAVLNLIRSSDFKGIGGTPTSSAYAEAAAYLLGTTTGGGAYSGQNLVKNALVGTTAKYKSPIDLTSSAECSGQGIYFLTDGQPQTPTATPTSTLMAKALNRSSYTLTAGLTNNGANDNATYTSDWQAIGSFAKSLNDVNVIKTALGTTDAKRSVITAVVGFGSIFKNAESTTDPDGKNAYSWGLKNGNYGKGGFLAATESQQIVDNLNNFIGEVGGAVPSVSVGSSTIPIDALNPELIQPFSYFPQFEPKVASNQTQQLWLGNLKKYHVVNNGIYASASGGSANIVVKDSTLRDLADIWANTSITYAANTPIFSKGGALSQLVLGTKLDTSNTLKPARKLLTDYVYDGTQAAESQLSQNLDLVGITHTYTQDNNTKTDSKARALMSLLGYNIPEAIATNGADLSSMPADLRQMGSVMHSLPVLLTQSGKAVATLVNGKVVIGSESRDDYAMFSTTQGLLHVVNADSGIEEFSFVPKELIARQSETFRLNGGNTTGGKNALYYGLDGEWVAHTVYVADSNGKLTVKGIQKNVIGSEEDKENLEGKQWVYGGMRMGGRSYYALDLTDISQPKIKFHIDPSTAKVYSQDHKSGTAYAALSNMGQSWSKPKLDYVNWKGQRKLVMFVAGGYDAGGPDGDGLYSASGVRTGYDGYEKYNYEQKNKKGAGVYMFDADNGDLLWYADSNAPTTGGTPPSEGSVTDLTTAHVVNNDLKYSVVSEIKTVDRNNDGIVDHLYFGDLAGQAFRADFKNDGSTTQFNSQVTKILDLHKGDGTSPRFYYQPVFTAHYKNAKTESGSIVIASFISGNKSSPLLATSDSPSTTGHQSSSGLEYDGVYAVYEYDIHPNGQFFPTTLTEAKTLDPSLAPTTSSVLKLKKIMAIAKTSASVTGASINATNGWGGWYYQFDKKMDGNAATQSIVKGLTPLIAMEGNLYVTMYDASEAGTSSGCGAGVKGQSFTKRLCLPTGVCETDAEYTYNLGAGIVSLNVGPSSPGTKSIIVPDPESICTGDNCSPCKGADCKAGEKFIPAGGALKFIPNRWYERYAKAS